jgi:hypothetical protein
MYSYYSKHNSDIYQVEDGRVASPVRKSCTQGSFGIEGESKVNSIDMKLLQRAESPLYIRIRSEANLSLTWAGRTSLGQVNGQWFKRFYRGSNVCTVVQRYATWSKGLYRGPKVCTVVQRFAPWSQGLHRGLKVCTVVQTFVPWFKVLN